MRVFVINMRESCDRRDAASRKLAETGIRYEFFDAVSGAAAIDNRMFDGFDQREFLLNTGRRIAPGEIGCFASHRSLWAHCVTLNESIMILEDDFDLLDNFAAAARSAAALIDRVGYLRLQVSGNAATRTIAAGDEFQLAVFTKAPFCTLCYCVSPAVARRFIDKTRILDAPVDVFIKNYWRHGQPLYALTPFAVAPSILSTVTTIPGRAKSRPSLHFAIRRGLRRSGWSVGRWLFNLQRRLTAKSATATATSGSNRAPGMVIAANSSD